jgi:DNA-binding MarR family transcriptional regulator
MPHDRLIHHSVQPITMPKPAATEADALSYGMLHGLVGYQLRLAQIALFRDFGAAFAEFDVTPGLFGALIIIEANPGLKQNQLARAIHLDRSTVVTVIDNLERRKLVERRVLPNDRRSNAIWLTRDGSALLKQLKRRVAAHEKRLVKHLSPAERETLVGLLQKIFPELR